MIAIAYAIAILLPILFLYIIYSQDLYGQGKFGHVLLAAGWGLAAFGGAYGLNGLIGKALFNYYDNVVGISSFGAQSKVNLLIPVLVAPIVEEVLKSLILVYLGRRMTYFIDGAIYGFASGIAFSILENIIIYIPGTGSGGQALLLAILRTFSTCLMHGAASALVGTAVGRFRYGRGGGRTVSVVLGWIAAIGLHMGFNRLAAYAEPGLGVLLGAFGIGIGGAVLIVAFIRWGLAEEKRWIGETLGGGAAASGVTKQEVIRIQQYDQIDELLEPIVERFGEEKAEQVEEFLLKQAHLGIKRKTRSMSQDTREQARQDQEIEQLQQEMEAVRNKVGVYCMIYVRAIFPEDALDLSGMLQQRVDAEKEVDMQKSLIWGALGKQFGQQTGEEMDKST